MFCGYLLPLHFSEMQTPFFKSELFWQVNIVWYVQYVIVVSDQQIFDNHSHIKEFENIKMWAKILVRMGITQCPNGLFQISALSLWGNIYLVTMDSVISHLNGVITGVTRKVMAAPLPNI